MPKIDTDRLARLNTAFRPSAPIDDQDLFAGRTPQIANLENAIRRDGQHAAVYGGRGVGKTSLAKVVTHSQNSSGHLAMHFTCCRTDTFSSIWKSIFSDLDVVRSVSPVGFAATPSRQVQSAYNVMVSTDTITPDDVRRNLEALTEKTSFVFFIDEFDGVLDSATKTQFADLIKILSDQVVAATIVLVGVADDIHSLIAEHASVQRSLVQIKMPTMSRPELMEIVDRGMKAANMTATDDFREDLVDLAQGLPNYVHLIAQNAGYVALEDGRAEVSQEDLEPAISRSIEMIEQSVIDTYHRATYSPRQTIYKEVLLACALAPRDERGMFGASDVKRQLQKITGIDRDFPAFAQHLSDFAGDGERGGILDKTGPSGRFRYRFVDAMLQPYVLMRSKIDGLDPSIRMSEVNRTDTPSLPGIM